MQSFGSPVALRAAEPEHHCGPADAAVRRATPGLHQQVRPGRSQPLEGMLCYPPLLSGKAALGAVLRIELQRTGHNTLAACGALQVIEQMRAKLRLLCAPVQLPIGLEEEHRGLVDLIKMKAFTFEGPNGETIREVVFCTGPDMCMCTLLGD